uniref:G protein-coupled receptor n=1 Tax=Syphacia muris TaxID=451379 RepID=A0A0N5ANT4_9BILA
MFIELSKIMEAVAFFALSIDRLTFLSNPLFYYQQQRKIQAIIQALLTIFAILTVTWTIYETLTAPSLVSTGFCIISEVLDRVTLHGIEFIRISIYLSAIFLYGIAFRRLKWFRNKEMMESEEMQLFVTSQVYYTKTILISIIATSLFVIAPITYSEIYTLGNGDEEKMEYYLLFVTIWNSIIVVALIVWRQADLRSAFVLPIRRLNLF